MKLSRISLAIAGVVALSGCNSSEDGTVENKKTDGYSYTSLTRCQDSDLNGKCDSAQNTGLSTQSSNSTVAIDDSLPSMVEGKNYILTAPANITFVSPFTTLLQNEVLFNPQHGGSIESAKTYLQTQLGDPLGIDFSSLNIQHGPVRESEILIASFEHALQLSGDSPYLKISAAVDMMLANKTLDIRDKLTQSDLDEKTVNLEKQTFFSGSHALSTAGYKSFSLDTQKGKMLLLTNDDKLVTLDAATGKYTSESATQGSGSDEVTPPIIYPYDSHDDDDDDDDDDDYGDGGTVSTSTITTALKGEGEDEVYLVYSPTINGDLSGSNTCNSSGDNGIFLTSLKKGSQATALTSATMIDTYAGASGVTPTPKPLPKPVADSQCFNNHIQAIIPSYKQDKLIAQFGVGLSGSTELQLLDSHTLKPTGLYYPIATSYLTPYYVMSESHQTLFVKQGSGEPILLDAEKLNNPRTIPSSGVKQAAFVNNESEIITSDGTSNIQWFNTKQPNAGTGSFTLDGSVRFISSTPDGSLFSVLTSSTLYLFDSKEKKILLEQPNNGSYVQFMGMLSDKIVLVTSQSIDYVQFSNISGTPVKVAHQLMDITLATSWVNHNKGVLQATTFDKILSATSIDADTATKFSSVDISWLPTNATTVNQLEKAVISGYFRGDYIRLEKSLK